MVYVGQALFLRCRNDRDILNELREKNIPISMREIGYLGKKFILYLALADEEAREKIKQYLCSRGGYILHLDGTCEGDSPHLMSAMDEITGIVLDNVKLFSENSDQIIPFLKQIKKAYGDPRGLVHDMGSGILYAIKTVFPDIADFICHYHFLKDLGTDLFGVENSIIRKSIKAHKIRGKLRKTAKTLKIMIDEEPALNHCLNTYLQDKKLDKPKRKLMPTVTAYILILWLLESNGELHGFGFPFDRSHLVFYQRLEKAHPIIMNLKNRKPHHNPLSQLAPALSKTLNDQPLRRAVMKMQKKVYQFDQLREAMRIALPESKKGLNDDGEKDMDMPTIKKRVTRFRQSDELKQLASTDLAYKKMLKQLDAYWEKLFADPIQVNTPAGTLCIQPQRTNNILERFFRDIKRGYRKKSGTRSLRKTLKTMMADVPLVKNLENQQYMKIILNGKSSLAERFTQIDIKLVRQALKETQNQIQNVPKGMRKVCKIQSLPEKLLKHTREKRAVI